MEPTTDTLDQVLAYLKALADGARLRIIGLLASEERSVSELADLLALRSPTVSHHLALLASLGLVSQRAEGTTHYYRVRWEALREIRALLSTPERLAALAETSTQDHWERKVLSDFFEGERLKEIPAQRKKRDVILRWLAERFTPGQAYTEPEVNAVLKRYHPDSATLRRELVGLRLLTRERGVYRRAAG
jgi:hypothetical protein